MGKLLLIFDGFDEMAAKVDRQQMINNFWELAKVVVPGAKVI
jgi:predicted NACHT family NTPase